MPTLDLAALYIQVKTLLGPDSFCLDVEVWEHGRGPMLEVSIYDVKANVHYKGPTPADAYRALQLARQPQQISPEALPHVVLP